MVALTFADDTESLFELEESEESDVPDESTVSAEAFDAVSVVSVMVPPGLPDEYFLLPTVRVWPL